MNPTELQSTLRDIAARASFISERRAPQFIHNADEKQIDERLKAWAQAVDEKGELSALERLWSWDGIDPAAAREMVTPVSLRDNAPLPTWAQTLQRILSQDLNGVELPPRTLDAPELLPFQDVLLPFILYAHSELASSKGYALLTPNAQGDLLRTLLRTLSQYAAEPLYLEFQARRNRQAFGALTMLVAKSGQTPADKLYRQFVAQLHAGGWLKFFAKYPVLARILATFTELNIETRRRFLERLADDLNEIERTFNNGAPLAQVDKLALSLSDLHRGGETVTAVTWSTPQPDQPNTPLPMGEGLGVRGDASGVRAALHLVYKPKDLGTEVAFNDLLKWINARSGLLDLRPLTVLNRGTHGWVTFAEHTECADEDAVAHYYRRVGMLLALTYALEATDCHYENLIASGEQPVLVDHETLFHHRVPEETDADLQNDALLRAVEDLGNSVLRVGLLPGWMLGKDKRVVYDASGLGAIGGQQVPFRRPRLVNPNTDAMELKFESGKLPATHNLPLLNGTPVPLDNYISDIVAGFRELYRFLLDHPDALLAEDGPLAVFKQEQVRFVFRATQVYGSLLRQAQQPALLRDGADYSIYLERLGRAHLQLDHKPTCYPLLAAERADMARLDTPFFTARTDSADLHLDADADGAHPTGRVVRHYFTGPSFELARQRIESLSERDLERQARIIDLSLHLRLANETRTAQRFAVERNASERRVDLPEPTDLAFIAAAVAMGRELRDQMFPGADGTVTWLGPSYMPDSGRYQLAIANAGMYDGLAGIGLFFAALARVTEDDRWRDLARGAFKPVRDTLNKEFEASVRNMGIGGAAGLGSIVYALSRAGALLNEQSLIDDAVAALRQLTPEQIQQDELHDVIGGAGGAVLAFLAVYESTGEPVALEHAQTAAQHLLNTRVETETGARSWRSISPRALTGFSHGAAGIALALLRLYRHTQDEELRAAALEALEFEDQEFDAGAHNWYDLRDNLDGTPFDPAHPKFAGAWCHGAPGIGLARVGALDVLDNAQMRADIDAALHMTESTFAQLRSLPDHLCCGSLGRLELTLTAGRVLRRPELIQAARRAGAEIIANAAEQGGYIYSNFTSRGVFAPGLFIGGAGIGYQFLRLAAPDRVPNVLLWE